MAAKTHSSTISRRRLGAELRRLRLASGLKSTQVAERLMVSQPKISHLENGNRAINPRDVRALCALYEVRDRQLIDALMEMARTSAQQRWWHSYSDLPNRVFIGLEAEADCLHSFEPMMIPELFQTPAYARAAFTAIFPALNAQQAATRLEVLLRRQRRIYDPDPALRLKVILDESALRRVVGSPNIMRGQLKHLNTLNTEPHITVQVLPHAAGAHPGLSGPFCILRFPGSPEAEVYLQRFTSHLHLRKPSDVQHYTAIYDHLQALALDPATSRHLITSTTATYIKS